MRKTQIENIDSYFSNILMAEFDVDHKGVSIYVSNIFKHRDYQIIYYLLYNNQTNKRIYIK